MRLYETHLPVSDLRRSIDFYTEVLGLTFAFEQKERNIAFLWIGVKDDSMLGLWGVGSPFGPEAKGDDISVRHFAIKIPLKELLNMPERLKKHGIESHGFKGENDDLPSVIGWMPSAQIYFRDPDGHSLEFISILDDEPNQDFIGTWSQWKDLDNH